MTRGDLRHEPFPVAVIGLSARGWHAVECLSLRDDAPIAGVWDADPLLRIRAREQDWPAFDALETLLTDSMAAGAIIDARLPERTELARQALAAGLHVLCDPPLALDAADATALYDLAEHRGRCCWAASPRRWDDDVLAAQRAIHSGRLGAVRTWRHTLAEWAPWALSAGSPPTDERDALLNIAAYPLLEQLQELTAAPVTDMRVFPCSHEAGLLALLTLADGALVQLELRRRALVSVQTGWMLHGDHGGYRGQKLYTLTADGELVDETLPVAPPPRDALLTAWIARCRNAIPDSERCRGVHLADVAAQLRAALHR